MKPILLFLIAIFTPFLLTAVMLLPVYAGIFGAAYVIYLPDAGPHPLMPHVTDVFYILDVYRRLLDYWMQQPLSAGFVHYTLPVIGLPLLGTLIAVFATWKLVSGLLNLFRLSASV